MAFLGSLFSVRFDEDTRRTIITILGFKIKLAGAALRKNKFSDFKEAGGNITECPKAEGLFRIIQFANLEILKKVDSICRENNLDLWLSFGTLLGAVRHKGYIPWDDDIDVEMTREHYEKLIEIINADENSDFYTELVHTKTDVNIFLKIKHKYIPGIFIDITPVDFINSKLSKKERLKLSNRIKFYRKLMNLKIRYFLKMNDEQALKRYILKKTSKFFNLTTLMRTETPDVAWGLDYQHKLQDYLVHPYSTYFPLKEIEFEGENFKCVNDEQLLLSEIYGNYMSWPSKIYAHHFWFKEGTSLEEFFGEDAFLELQKFLNKSKQELENI